MANQQPTPEQQRDFLITRATEVIALHLLNMQTANPNLTDGHLVGALCRIIKRLIANYPKADEIKQEIIKEFTDHV
jgi:hypothetical protein